MRSLTAAFAVALASGCMTAGPARVSLDADDAANQLRALTLSCAFEIDAVVDVRKDPTIQGYWRNGAEIANLAPYMEEKIRTWVPVDASPSPAERLDIELFRLTVSNKATVGFFDVVLRVMSDSAAPAHVRGRYASTIWFGHQDEFRAEVQRAVDAALVELHRHLEGRCS
jgi:hypothetical protein